MNDKLAKELFEIDLEEKMARIAIRRMEKSISEIRSELLECSSRRIDALRRDLKQSTPDIKNLS